MFQFIKYNENSTPTWEQIKNSKPTAQITPSIFFGHPSGYRIKSYDVWDEHTLKQFKVNVGSVRKGTLSRKDGTQLPSGKYDPILRLDTLDLYKDFDHTVADSMLNADNMTFSEISASCPVKFQRIHFKAARNGVEDEYSSIFLAGNPVLLDKNQTGYYEGTPLNWSPEYAGNSGVFNNRVILGSQQTASLSFLGVRFNKQNQAYARISPGFWVHRYLASYVVNNNQLFDENDQAYQIGLSVGVNYIYIERKVNGSLSFGVLNEYPSSSTSYLRRCLATIYLSVNPEQGKPPIVSSAVQNSIGDIHTW